MTSKDRDAPVEQDRAALNRTRENEKPLSIVIGMSPWKRLLPGWFPGTTVVQYRKTVTPIEFRLFIERKLLGSRQAAVYVWGYKHPAFVKDFCDAQAISFVRVEDGFLRSITLGASMSAPLSLCMDRAGMYFDPTGRSDLETLLQSHDFATDAALMARATDGISRFLKSRLSKYNAADDVEIERLYGPKDRKRVLVVGQVEGDMSLIKGCQFDMTSNDLVRRAREENPQAQIIYKPHPEVLAGTRRELPQSDPRNVSDVAMVLEQDVTLADAFRTIDHVYTMTSLAGFEALLRGIKVTCFGMPFYAGWGVTDDRQSCERRSARRSVAEIFAAAYLLYPRYFDPHTQEPITFEQALDSLQRMRQQHRITA